MYFKIYYGIKNNNIDITDICLKKCLKNNIIHIPKTDVGRAQIFGDPLFGILKIIFIYDDNKKLYTYDHNKDIFIDIELNKIYDETNIPDHISIIFNYKLKTILFTNARDENNIIEWIAHHLNLGFDKIYILDHLSKKPINSLIKKNPQIIIERNNNEISKFNCKKKFIENAISYSKKNCYDWMLYLDADEFLILNRYNNIKEFILEYKNYDLIGINWLTFGNNYHDINPIGTILENYTKCSSKINTIIKSVAKIDKIIMPNSPHVYNMTDNNKRIDIKYNILNIKTPWHSKQFKLDINTISIYIAHYEKQSYKTYLDRKINKIADNNMIRKKITLDELNKENNDLDNFIPRDKYNEINKNTIKSIKILN